MNYNQILSSIHRKVTSSENKGELATYIPELAKVDPEKFGAYLQFLDGSVNYTGAALEKFSIQSIAKVLSFTYAYMIYGGELWKRVDVEPAGTPFNSLVQLESDEGIPRNPFMNAGAIVICDILISHCDNAEEDLLQFIQKVSENDTITYSERIAKSEASVGYRNKALCYFLKSLGNIENEVEEVLDLYFRLSSIEMTCEELSKTFVFLANGGKTLSNKTIISPIQAKRINALMQTCGFYDEAGEFTFKVGLPGKSGVGGGIAAVHPGSYSIAVWSPKLNEIGNSYRGMKFLEQFTSETDSSIF